MGMLKGYAPSTGEYPLGLRACLRLPGKQGEYPGFPGIFHGRFFSFFSALP